MNMKRIERLLTALVVILGLFALALPAVAMDKDKVEHHNGKQLLGENIKSNGNHVIDKKGDYTASVEVKDGKVAGLHVKHAKKGEVSVKKYKTSKNMAQAGGNHFASFLLPQDQYLGTTWIGYAYVDEYGVQTIYWFPYDMILDGATGAIEYVPVA